jgi:hypothetical protein
MPEEAEKPDYIVTDAETRRLMAMLMGEWKWLDTTLGLWINTREDELLGGAGDKESRFRELLEGAEALLRARAGNIVRDALDKSVDEISRIIEEYLASGGLAQPQKRRRKRTGRPSRLPTEEVERSAIKIIRDIGAGPGDLRKVAMIHYGAGDYKKAAPADRKREGDKFAALLARHGLNYHELVKKAFGGFGELLLKSKEV